MEKHKEEFINAYRSLLGKIEQLSAEGKINRNLEGVLIASAKNLAEYFNNKYIMDKEFALEVKTEMEGTFRTILDDFADKVREEGREKGIEEGIEAGRLEERQKAEQENALTIRNLKQLRQFSNEEIARIMRLPLEQVERVS